MAKDVTDVLGAAIGKLAREAAKNIAADSNKSTVSKVGDRVQNALSERLKDATPGSKGLAAGVGLATVVPLAAKGASKLAHSVGGNDSGNGGDPLQKAGEKLGSGAKKSMMPGGGKGKSQGLPGVGKGRRMPIQQAIDVGLPVDVVYKHWTNWEEWPKFMHRLQSVSQEDDKKVSFKTKIWGISKEFNAEITDQQECERIKWKVTEGVTHSGVVTFHEIGPRLTRVDVNLDVQPGSLIEKAARGMRHVKRAVRADMARFKAYVLMEEDGPQSPSQSESSGREQRTSSGNRAQSGSSRSSATKRRSSSARKRGSSSGDSSSARSRKRGSTSSRRSSGGPSSGGRSSGSSSGSSTNARKRSSQSANGNSSSNGRSSSAARKRTTASANGSNGSSSSKKSSKKRASTRS